MKKEAQSDCALCASACLPERFPAGNAGCTFGVEQFHFTEHRHGPVLLPESICVPFGAVSGLSRASHPIDSIQKACRFPLDRISQMIRQCQGNC